MVFESDSGTGRRVDPGILGGGAINEVARTGNTRTAAHSGFDPSHQPSHLWHALEGVKRYPNYVSRWSAHNTALDRLEDSLVDQLEAIRMQRQENEQFADEMASIVQAVVNKSPARWNELLRRPSTWEDLVQRVLDPAAARAIQDSKQFAGHNKSVLPIDKVMDGSIQVELDIAPLTRWIDEVVPDVFGFPLLSTEYCHEMCEFMAAIGTQLATTSTTSSAHARRAVRNLDLIGLSWLNDLVFNLFVKPLAGHLFSDNEVAGGALDWRNGYVAGYSATPAPATPRERLVPHTDDSEVTLNVCLGEEGFEGGNVVFSGLRGESRPSCSETYEPMVGRAILHSGRHIHSVTTVTGNHNRYAWILWARSWKGVRSQVCPCCWLNRRQDSTCISGPQWN